MSIDRWNLNASDIERQHIRWTTNRNNGRIIAMNMQTTGCALPGHPFFETANDPANFTDCINVIERVSAVIELFDALTLDEEHAGLSPNAAFGFYWIIVLMRSALDYVSKRLVLLESEKVELHRQESAFCSALIQSLYTLDDGIRHRFLNSTAAQMDVARSEVDQFIERLIVT
jgi:hypothetical protein